MLALIVQHSALLAFFSADDLVHLQQATGLLPTPHQPWRFLTQVVYFRGMVELFGPRPLPFFAVNLTLHAANVALFFRLMTARGIPRAVAGLASVLFGACPLLFMVVAHAVIINDIAALFFMLLALGWLSRPGLTNTIVGTFAAVVALLCKESVLFLPLLLLLPSFGTQSLRTASKKFWPVLTIVALTAIGFIAARAQGAAPGGSAYQLSLSAPFHNLMTYTVWFFQLDRPLPDLVRSLDPHAWYVGLPIASLFVIGLLVHLADPPIILGLSWWILGLVPVLPLRNSAYAHYLYVALPGLAMATAGMICGVLAAGGARGVRARVPALRARSKRVAATLTTLAALAYVAQAYALVGERLRLRVEGSYLPLDPQIRSIVVAGQAVESIAQQQLMPHTRLVILTPQEEATVIGARTGHTYAAGKTLPGAYDLQRAILSNGRALRVFFPQIDSVLFTPHWSRTLNGWVIAKRGALGTLMLFHDTPSGRHDLIRAYEDEGTTRFAAELRDSLGVNTP